MDNIQWQPHPGPQTLALKVGGIRELLYGGARGGGKSDAGMVWLLKPPHIYNPNYRALVVRRNAEDLTDWIDRARAMYRGRAEISGKPSVIKFPDGPVFRLGHLKDKDSFTKYLGHEYQKILMEELTLIPDELRYKQLVTSCRTTDPTMPAEVFATTNPGGVGGQWVKKRWGLGKMGRYKPNEAYPMEDGRLRMFIPATVEDNPSITEGDPAYIAMLESLPEPLRSAWRYGDWDCFMGQMFALGPEHIIKPRPIPDNAPLYMTFDWGFGHPYSLGWWWVDNDGRLYRFAEIYGAIQGQYNMGIRQTDPEIADAIIRMEKEQDIWGKPITRLCDPTSFNKKPDYKGGGQGPSTADEFAKKGLTLTRGDPSRILKIRQFHQRLHIPRENGKQTDLPMMLIYDTCIDFIETVTGLQADPNNPEYVDKKMADHCFEEAALICQHFPVAMGEPYRGTALTERGVRK